MKLPDGVEFQRLDARQARDLRTTVEDIYTRSYVDAIASGDPFDSSEQFMHRFDSYTDPMRGSVFAMVVAYIDGKAAGQTWGLDTEPEYSVVEELSARHRNRRPRWFYRRGRYADVRAVGNHGVCRPHRPRTRAGAP